MLKRMSASPCAAWSSARATSLLLVSTLALGLAANAAIFNVLDAVVLRAFDFPNQPRLVRVHETSRDFDGIDLSNVAPANLIDWQAQSGTTFRDLVGLEWWDASLRGRESAERVQGYRVGPGVLRGARRRPGPGPRLPGRGGARGPGPTRRPRPRALAAQLRRRAARGPDRDHRQRALRGGRHRAAGLPVPRRRRGLGAARAAGRRDRAARPALPERDGAARGRPHARRGPGRARGRGAAPGSGSTRRRTPRAGLGVRGLRARASATRCCRRSW